MSILPKTLVCGVFLAGSLSLLSAKVIYPGVQPGIAKINSENGKYILKNSLLDASYEVKGGKLVFQGLNSQGSPIAQAGGELFILQLGDGKVLKSSEMTLGDVKIQELAPNSKSINLAQKEGGKAIVTSFTSGNIRVVWRAILRNNSHYLRNELEISTVSGDADMKGIIAMQYPLDTSKGGAQISGNARGPLIVTPTAFAALETPMGINSILGAQAEIPKTWNPEKWNPADWKASDSDASALKSKYGNSLALYQGVAQIDQAGELAVTFQYKGGNHRMNLAGIELVDEAGKVLSSDYHTGFSGQNSQNNVYKINVAKPGTYLLRYWAETKTESISSNGEISYSMPIKLGDAKKMSSKPVAPTQMAQGFWSRKTKLQAGETWKVSSVLGLFEPGQERRSFLSYIERERVAPYRPFIHYNSWYELNINRNNDKNPEKRMTEAQCLEVVKEWKSELFDKRKTTIDAFVWDDGWDEFNSLWDFHKMFPQGFKNIDVEARKMKSGIGAWLGPVGGYGQSKGLRLANWNAKHPENKIGNFKLSNKEYFDAFVGRCGQMVRDYDMRYFKFDGISTNFHSKGPGNEEDAEGILKVVSELRKAREDLYINCTVGTWASPFWFRYADSVWRQENDWGDIGEGDKRDKWITYRDRLVHEVFVQGSPLMPINSLMTHGLMVTKFGPPNAMPKDPQNVIKEMRCAFACGSSLQELYVDRDLMKAQNGKLWDELVVGINWIRRNADVLDDVHWVGGNPWDKETKQGSVYGWAAWNPQKATLALRNSSAQEKTLTSTLRKILDVPAKVKGKITFKNSYSDQRPLEGFTDKALDIDAPVTFTIKPFEVFVYEAKEVK